jgi:hypothetical protein
MADKEIPDINSGLRLGGESTQGEGRREIREQEDSMFRSFLKHGTSSLPLLFLRRELCWPDPSAGRPTT